MTTNPPSFLSAIATAIRPAAVEAELCKRSFYEFFMRAWPHIEPGVELREGLHIRIVCDALQAVAEGRCKRLIINIPPRHTKSRLASVAFPAWLWLRNATTKVLTASHSDELALELAEDSRKLIETAWFSSRWPSCALVHGNNRKRSYKNVSGGSRRAVSAGGKATGFGGDILIGDDVQDAQSAKSPEYLESTFQWWKNTFCRRLNNSATGSIVLVMQRLEVGDLTDKLIGIGGWQQLCLPAAYEPVSYAPEVPSWLRDPRTYEGLPLWGTPDTLAALKAEVADRWVWSAQYQQRPIPAGGVILRREAYKLVKRSMLPKVFATFVSWDTAATNNQRNDPTGAVIIGLSREPGFEGVFVLGTLEEWLTYPQLAKRIPEVNRLQPPGTIHLIEAAGPTGLALYQQLSTETQLPCVAIDPRPDGGKEERAKLMATYLENGLVHIVDDLPELEKLLTMSDRFPNCSPRDIVDALIQAVLYCCRKFSFDSSPAVDELDQSLTSPPKKGSAHRYEDDDDWDD